MAEKTKIYFEPSGRTGQQYLFRLKKTCILVQKAMSACRKIGMESHCLFRSCSRISLHPLIHQFAPAKTCAAGEVTGQVRAFFSNSHPDICDTLGSQKPA